MHALLHPVAKRILPLASVIALLVCTSLSCVHRDVAGNSNGPHCGFADPELTASMGICHLAAEYYVANHEWPVSKAQLEEQNRKLLTAAEGDGQEIPTDEAAEIARFLNRFNLVECHRSGANLIMHYRFNIGQRTVEQTVKLHPKPTVDEILQSVSKVE